MGIEKLIDEISKRLSKKWFIAFGIVIMVYYLTFTNRTLGLVISSFLINLLNSLLKSWYYVSGVLLPLIVSYLLFWKSTKIFIEKLDKYYPDIDRWESLYSHFINVNIIDHHKEKTREIKLFNPQKEDIENLSGEVLFSRDSYVIDRIPITCNLIEANHGERILLNDIETIRKYQFDKVQVHIKSAKVGGHEIKNETFHGPVIYKSHYLIFNEFKFFLRWEYSWLRQKYQRAIRILLSFFTTPALYKDYRYVYFYRSKPWYYLLKLEGESWIYFWKRKANQIKLLLITSFILLFVSFSIVGFYKTGSIIIDQVKYLFKALISLS